MDISKRSSKVFRLAHGRHTVELWARNNGGQLYGAYLSIAEAATGEMIPVSCTENEIREFLKTPIGETLPAQVHDWERIRLGDEPIESARKARSDSEGLGPKVEKRFEEDCENLRKKPE